ncbi:PQQ-dependent sugar dehydrogenase [Aidingimonas halophila]|uniref:Glucose/arabinose dehydrogenase, beta-propeller fold n=1 Tax=Aidingimonas halophila TaxID=574349 RepID=A0A1H2TW32_9GAMM|nr:PQQ-dependent sugar dehydrogenase [Aidingimonas halophila]GHC38596.1 glucose dehydrogenase [Aidingimonas halophila]SDW48206.1 Glucose/arabinose dehydrogenase, beta-propeller fold [Aidingimonas halophila]
MSPRFATRSAYGIVTLAMITGLSTAAFSSTDTPDLSQETLLSGLEDPWDMAFLPDGTMFFTEKCLGLSVRDADGDVNHLLGMEDSDGYASTADDLMCSGQAGMNGVAIDPDFDDNRYVYVYSASNMSSPITNRVLRLTVNEDFTEVSDRTDIVDDIPFKPEATDHPFGDAGAHNGGRIRFGPEDGYLYVPTGDNHNSELPQSPDSLGGKVLRIDRAGEAAEDNDPPAGFDPRIYTYGHRNVQGLTFHPETNQPIVTEHGPWHSDEVNALVNGGNSGWDPRPNMSGRGDCPDNYCGYEPNQNEGMSPKERAAYMPLTDTTVYPNAMTPAWQNNGLSQGINGTDFLTGEQWRGWDGRMAIGFMGIGFGDTAVGQRINLIDLHETGEAVNDVAEMHVPMGPARFRSLVQGPDGNLYAAVDEGNIYRIIPE